MKLGEALIFGQAKTILINDDDEYVIAGVQSYGKGIINRRTELGKNLKMKTYQVIEPNFLMWCKVDTKNGAFGITKDCHKGSLASTNMALAKINTDKFNPLFIERLFTFNYFHSYITHLSSGSTNRKYLTPKQLCELVEVPNLSKDEQNQFIRFVDKVESLKINAELTHQLTLVKQLRQSFLREAMQGKLTADFRSAHPELITGENSAQALLEKIKVEKKQLIKDGKLKKEKELSTVSEDEIPFEINENDYFIRLGEICNIEKGKIGIQQAVNGIYPLVVTGENRLSHNEAHFFGKGIIIPLVSSTGHGHASLKRIHFEEGEFAVGNILACVTTYLPQYFNLKFIYHYLDTYKEWYFVEKMKGAANVSLKISSIQETPIPIIPIEIQNKFEELMRTCDELEASIRSSQQQNEMLLREVLREALEG